MSDSILFSARPCAWLRGGVSSVWGLRSWRSQVVGGHGKEAHPTRETWRLAHRGCWALSPQGIECLGLVAVPGDASPP